MYVDSEVLQSIKDSLDVSVSMFLADAERISKRAKHRTHRSQDGELDRILFETDRYILVFYNDTCLGIARKTDTRFDSKGQLKF